MHSTPPGGTGNNSDYVVNNNMPITNHDGPIYHAIVSRDKTGANRLCHVTLCACMVLGLSVLIALVPVVYVAYYTRLALPEDEKMASEMMISSPFNWTICWPCNDNPPCCVVLNEKNSMCKTIAMTSTGALSCVYEDAAHMVLNDQQKIDCGRETQDTLRGMPVDRWTQQNPTQKLDNVTIRDPGLYMFYAKIAYYCPSTNSLGSLGDGYNTKLVVNQNLNEPLGASTQLYDQQLTGSTTDICYNSVLMAAGKLYRGDVVRVSVSPPCLVVRRGGHSHFGFYRIG